MKIIRQSVRTVANTYVGIAFGVLNTMILYPLILTEEQVGLTRILINAALLFATFASLGAANIPNLFFPYFKDQKNRHNGFLFFLLFLGIIGSAIFTILFLIFKPVIVSIYIEKSPILITYIYYLIPFTVIIVLWNILETYTIFNQFPVVPSFIREVGVRGLLSLGLIFLFIKIISFDWYVRFIVLSYGAALVATLGYLHHKDILFLKPKLAIFSSSKVKEMMVYGGFVLMGNISAAIIASIDGLMLGAYSGLKSAGIYTIAFFIAQIVEIPKRSLSQVLIPLVSEANKINDLPKLHALYRKSSINQLIVGGIIFLCIWANIENIFQLIPNGDIYIAGKWVVFYIGLAKLFDMVTGINSEIIGTSKYYKYDLLFYIFLSVVGIGTNLLLIPAYGMIGAAIASAVSIFLFNTARYLFILKIYKMQPFSISSAIVIALGIGSLIVSALLPLDENPLVNIVARSFVIALMFVGGSILLHVSEDINGIVEKIFFRIKEAFKKL